MKLPIQLRYRLQIGLALTVLMAGIIINNISSRHNLELASTSVTAIYNDRLMASTYLFELTDNLYKKERLAHPAPPERISAINNDIAALIKKYENTVLTHREAALWRSFKLNLQQYNSAAIESQHKDYSFEKTVSTLKLLSDLQAKEGSFLYKDTRSSLGATTLGSYLEIILAIATGVIAIFLIGISRRTLDTFTQSPSLN